MPVIICDVCDEPATQVRPLVRVYDLGWMPLDVHEDCWTDNAADEYAQARAAVDRARGRR